MKEKTERVRRFVGSVLSNHTRDGTALIAEGKGNTAARPQQAKPRTLTKVEFLEKELADLKSMLAVMKDAGRPVASTMEIPRTPATSADVATPVARVKPAAHAASASQGRNALLASIVKGKKLRRVEGSSPGRTPSAPSAKLNASVSDAAAMLSRALSNKFSNAGPPLMKATATLMTQIRTAVL